MLTTDDAGTCCVRPMTPKRAADADDERMEHCVRNTRRASSALLIAALAACGTTGQQPVVTTPAGGTTPAEQARLDSGRPPYTGADVRFLQGMIHHHAQALTMAAMAPTHGAREDIRVLAARIAVSQRDEIATMQRWLRARGEMVPDPEAHHPAADGAHDMAAHHRADSASGMPGMAGMPGMLTPQQLAQLDSARGPEFDRLFLTLMIQHHQGAVEMVESLFASRGAGQDPEVFRIASDVSVDQITEIERMRSMLAALLRNDDGP